MTTKPGASRRSFIWTAGAALSVPVAAVAATLPQARSTAPGLAVVDGDPLRARLGMLEDVNAIRALNQAYARHVNAGSDNGEAVEALFCDASAARVDPSIRGVAAEGFGERDVIEVAPDRQTATGLVHCTVRLETLIGPSCPLVDMAREQGGGVVTRWETGIFENVYARAGGNWKIQRSTYRPAEGVADAALQHPFV
jgi:SnoaL-like domain